MSETGTAGQSGQGAAGLAPATVVELPVPLSLVPAYAGNIAVSGAFEPHRAAGFCVRSRDVEAGTAAEIQAQHGLADDADWVSTDTFHVLRFLASWPALFTVPFGGSTADGARRMGTSRVYPEPFLGTGYTAFAPRPVPQYWLVLTELPVGAELWRIDASGRQEPLAAYLGRQIGWRPQPGVPSFGPQPWAEPPQPLRTAVRRGLRANYQGVGYDADFGPEPGRVTLYRGGGPGQPGQSRAVLDAECDALVYVRLLCTWRDANFEAVDADADTVTLNYLGESHPEATSLGLNEIGYRVWRAVVPRAEITQYEEERREVGVQAHFGR